MAFFTILKSSLLFVMKILCILGNSANFRTLMNSPTTVEIWGRIGVSFSVFKPCQKMIKRTQSLFQKKWLKYDPRGVGLLWGDHTSQACCTYYPGTTEWKLRSQGKKWINETHSNAKITHFSWYCNSYNPNYIFLGSSFKILLIGTRFTWPWRNYIRFDRKGIKRTHKPLTD